MAAEPPFLLVKPFATEEDFYRDATEDSNWEYLDGRIVMHSPASNWHEDHFRFLLTLRSAYLDERGGAVVRGSRYPMRLDARWSPEPDLLVVRDERRHWLGTNRLEGPADLVIEIASDSDPGLDVREKRPRYRAAGIDEIWLVNLAGEAAEPRRGPNRKERRHALWRRRVAFLPARAWSSLRSRSADRPFPARSSCRLLAMWARTRGSWSSR